MTGELGAETEGLDLSDPISDSAHEAVAKALADHLLDVILGQQLDLDRLERLTLQLGRFGETPFITPVDDYGGQRRVMYRATLAGERPP